MRTRDIISIVVVVTFVGVTALIAVAPVVTGLPPAAFTEHLRSFSSVYSGVVGIIVGFYFGQNQQGGEG